MTGGLMQLVAYGAQDIYLTGNPMITYFKVVYRRHTNFAMESIRQTFNGTVGFGNNVSALISRNGDLVSGMMLEINLPATGAQGYMQDIGHHLVSDVAVEIGGQQIDKHYADWLEVWAQLTVPAGQKVGYREMIGQSPLAAGGAAAGNQVAAAAAAANTIFVPLQFWFCRNVGLALPLIALQYHEVKVNINFATFASVAITNATLAAGSNIGASLWVDYIYLDTDERRRFAQVSHEYLIEQLQVSANNSVRAAALSANVNLNFNHPVKELVWIGTPTERPQRSVYNLLGDTMAAGRDNLAGRTETGRPSITSAVLNLNGQQRFAARDGTYFNLVQTRCHTNVPDSRGIYVYSFALKPEDHQPSGSCNFSRIDNASLVLTLPAGVIAGNITVFAVNYNVLRIMSGMGGMAYSN